MLNFRLISEFQTIHRRPFELVHRDTLRPTDVRPLVDGEWLQLDVGSKMDRGGDNVAGTVDEATVPSYCLFAEQGRYETQAIGKVPMLFMGPYEAETKIMDSAGLSSIPGDALSVQDMDIGGIVRRGLRLNVSGYVVGYVTRLPSENGGWLRFVHFA